MSKPTWSLQGPHFANCNCDFGCPCQFNALPTDGTCRAVVAWRVDKGHYGDVELDGLHIVNTYGWPGAVHEGRGEMQLILDERANEAQRQAIIDIMNGEGTEPGMIMIQIYRSMCDTVHEPIIAPIELSLDMDARIASLKVPSVIETTLEPIKNPITGAEHRARFDLPLGKEFHFAEVASGTTKGTGAVALDFEASHAHIATGGMTSDGPTA